MGPKGPGNRSLDSNGRKMAKFTRAAIFPYNVYWDAFRQARELACRVLVQP